MWFFRIVSTCSWHLLRCFPYQILLLYVAATQRVQYLDSASVVLGALAGMADTFAAALPSGSYFTEARIRETLRTSALRGSEKFGRLLDGVEASILHLSLVGFALPLCLSHSYDLLPGAPTSGVIPPNNPAHQEIYQTRVMIDPIL